MISRLIASRLSRSFALIALAIVASPPTDADDPTLQSTLQDFAQAHCLDCHSGDEAESGFDLEALLPRLSDPSALPDWEIAVERISDGDMPPEDASQPSDVERAKLLDTLLPHLSQLSQSTENANAAPTWRRLNRHEYENTLRDLLSLPHLDVHGMLPPDATGHGFDKVGSALELSYVQVARYLEAAELAIDQAICLHEQPVTIDLHLPAKTNGRLKQVITKEKDAVLAGETVMLLRQPNTAQAPWWWSQVTLPADGNYRIRMKTFGAIWDRGQVLPADRTHVVTYQAVQGTNKRSLVSMDLARSGDGDPVHEFTAFLKRGDEIQFWLETLDDRNIKKTPVNEYTAPAVGVDWLEVTGPIEPSWPPASYHVLFGGLPVQAWDAETGLHPPTMPMIVEGVGKRARSVRANPKRIQPLHVVSQSPESDARRLLLSFATKAFRRDVAPSEIAGYVDLVNQQLRRGACFQDAMRLGLQAVLCSPDFLFVKTKSDSAHALASQVAYFLTNSMPDEQLLRLADDGSLLQPDVLADQVDRLLDDPRSQRFIESFTGQWLDLRRITITQPDEVLYPEFDSLLLDSMVAETRAYFAEMLNNNLPVRALVDSDFAMINGRLAEHYGITNVDGVSIRRVAIPDDNTRGGLLTHASILKVTANGTTTSPVIRGVWIADRLLGRPAPPPPPNTPAVEPDLRGTTTIRDQLAAHRDVPGCASCHTRIDPYGFALESFDVIGGYRTHYRSLENGQRVSKKIKGDQNVRYKRGLPVDCSGVMPGGREFATLNEFRAALLDDEKQIARNLLEKLTIYATGTDLSFRDREAIETTLKTHQSDGYPIRSLVHAAVQNLRQQ